MKHMTFAVKVAGAATLAGSTQAYSQIMPLHLPTDLSGVSGGSATEYYDISTGTTSSTPTSGSDLTFEVFNNGGVFSGVSPIKTTDGVAGSSFVYYGATYAFATPLLAGTKIGSDTQTFLKGTGTPGGTYLQSLATFPQPAGTPEFIGFQFAIGGSIHNGWLELNTTPYVDPTHPGNLTFIGGAYSTAIDGTVNGDIYAGAVPEPGTLSSLVVGAAALGGIGLFRRRRSSLMATKN